MGTSLNATLEIAKQTLQNTQVAIQTSSHNIANADNTSYARQEVQFVTNPALEQPTAWVGTGAKVGAITQYRDQLIENQLRDTTTQKSGYETLSTQLDTASSILSDNGDTSISQALGKFWDAWDSLSQDPGGSAASTVVKSTAQNLANTIQQTYQNLSDYTTQVKSQIKSDVTQANTLLTQIAQANKEIVKQEAGGLSANDLRDTRYQDITELAKLLPIQSSEQSNGAVEITMNAETGTPPTSTTLTLLDSQGNQAEKLVDYDASSQQFDFTTDLTGSPPSSSTPYTISGGGTLASLSSIYTKFGTTTTGYDLTSLASSGPTALPSDPTYLDRLNVFTASLAQSVNTANETNSSSPVPVFDLVPTGQNKPIAVDASFTPNSSEAANISSLQDQSQTALGTTFSGFLSDIQQQLGSDASNASDQASFQSQLYQELQTQQQSVSGVSVDEEMVNIIKYQQVYSAAAKVIKATSDMLNTVINAA